MASTSFQLQFLLPLFLSIIKFISSEPIVLEVTKDVSTLQYTTQIPIGTPQSPTNLVLNLGGQSLWILDTSPPSSSRKFIHRSSLQCSAANSRTRNGVDQKTTVATCESRQENPITGVAGRGDLAEDLLRFSDDTDPARFVFSYMPENLANGLASGARGMLGLGKSRIALLSQITNNFGLARKFSICLSSSDGGVIVAGTDISKSLLYTPLVFPQGGCSEGYYVNVKSIKINGKKLSLGNKIVGPVEISTITPYTIMKGEIYEVFVKAYVKVATESMNMTRVSPVAPFGVCFRSEFGARVPEIDLVMQSEMVKWRVEGRNSMVRVSEEIMCLGFLDGGLGITSSIVLGGYQLEDRILEFNLGTSMLGFSSSLLNDGSSCSSIRGSVSRGREFV